MSVTFLFG